MYKKKQFPGIPVRDNFFQIKLLSYSSSSLLKLKYFLPQDNWNTYAEFLITVELFIPFMSNSRLANMPQSPTA